jgi:AcrR family transcriptional regulator
MSSSEPKARKRNTRTRILVAALLLFNELGVSKATTNQISDEIDISPGNLHYHFKTKADLVAAIVAAFEVDAKIFLEPPHDAQATIEDLWMFLHLLLERTTAYRFLFRDFETIVAEYPESGTRLQRITLATTSIAGDYLRQLRKAGVLKCNDSELDELYRNFVIIALYSERFDALSGQSDNTTAEQDQTSQRAARSALRLLIPYLQKDDAALIDDLAARYE